MSSTAPTIRLAFVSADPAFPDPAAVDTMARTMLTQLRSRGATLTPEPTGARGAEEVFQWMLNAAIVAAPVISLLDMSLTLAQLLTEIRSLRTPAQPASAPVAVTINFYYGSAPPLALPSATTPTDAALLEALLATHLPDQLNPADVRVEVQVPPTPPNTI